MDAHSFVPQFRSDVTVTTVWNGRVVPVNPLYCATDKTAADLAEIFADLKPTVVKASPLGPMFGPLSVSDQVAALQFTAADGVKAVVLAGTLASYFQFFGTVAGERMCREEVAGTLDYNRKLQGE